MRRWIDCDIIFSLLTIFGEGGLYCDIIFSSLTVFSQGVIISWHHIFTPDNIWSGGDYIVTWYSHPDNIWSGGDYIVTLYFHSWQYLVRGWLYCDIIFSVLTIFGEGVIISWHIFTPEDIWWGGDYIVTLQYHFWHYPRIWHWRWWYLNIFTIQIWLCSDTRVLLFISIYSPHETWEVEVIIFKHNTLFAVETQCFGTYVNGLYQQFVMNKNV